MPSSDPANLQQIREWLERNSEPALPADAVAARRQAAAAAAAQ